MAWLVMNKRIRSMLERQEIRCYFIIFKFWLFSRSNPQNCLKMMTQHILTSYKILIIVLTKNRIYPSETQNVYEFIRLFDGLFSGEERGREWLILGKKMSQEYMLPKS